ncbi:MAG: hypothetical protein AAF529_14560 [Pseudomonadota bacterium]
MSTLVPANGNGSCNAVTPAEWLTGDLAASGGAFVPNIIPAWNGGVWDPIAKELGVHGGGHDDSSNNMYCGVDLKGSATYEGFSRYDISALADVPYISPAANQLTYDDGRPGSIHSYNGIQYDPTTRRLFRVGGAIYRSGNNIDRTWTFDRNTGLWTQHANYPGATGSGAVMTSAINVAERKIFAGAWDSGQCAFFDIDNLTWGGAKNVVGTFWPSSTSGYAVSACSETSGEIVTMAGNQFYLTTVSDWANETVSMQPMTVSGYSGASSACLFWDSLDDSFWAFGGTSQASHQTLYHITGTGTSRTATAHTLTGASISLQGGASNYRGSFNRGGLAADWRIIFFLASSQSAPYAIKIP